MNRETWVNAEVRSLLKDNFIPVYVDQDGRPDISQRYERWGWPATIIFRPDGTEIVKLRGFYSPQFFLPILTETVKDPSPVDYPDPGGTERERTLATGLSDTQREEILGFIDNAWDEEHGGWSKSKFVDGNLLIWALQRARQGDTVNTARIKRVPDPTLARNTFMLRWVISLAPIVSQGMATPITTLIFTYITMRMRSRMLRCMKQVP